MIFSLAGLVGPLAAGLVALFGDNRNSSNKIVQSLFALSSAMGFGAAALMLSGLLAGTLQPTAFSVSGIPFVAVVDAWSAFFLVLINIGVFLASVFALGYLPKYAKVYSFPTLNFASALFIVGMQAAVLAGSVFAFLLFWEVMSIAAYFLVIADREDASLDAGFIYFVMTHLGVACLLAGFLLLAQGNPMASFASLHTIAAGLPMSTLALAFFLIFAGFGSKAGLVPLHLWLPRAHPQAPSHSSALMSGVMLKIAVYGFLRVALFVFPPIPVSWAAAVVVVGLLSAFYGVLSAAVESDLKRLLAWSSVENLGLIFAMIGMGFAFNALNMKGTPFFIAALLHALNHTIFKSGLFLAAGAIISETHTRDLDEMGGLANAWPIFSGAFLALVFAAAALPPLGTFYGEWIFLQSLASGMLTAPKSVGFLLGIVMSVTALVGGLAIFTFAKTFSAIFLSKPRSEHASHVKPLGRLLVLPVASAALASAAIGMFAAPIAGRLGALVGTTPVGLPLNAYLKVADGMIFPASIFTLFFALVLAVTILRRLLTGSRPIRVTDTWDCGQPITARMEYTATGFAAPIRFFFRSVLLSRNSLVTERVSPGNPWILRRRLEWSTQSVWEKWIYRPIASGVIAAATAIKRLQSGVIQFYILLILVTLAIVLIFVV